MSRQATDAACKRVFLSAVSLSEQLRQMFMFAKQDIMFLNPTQPRHAKFQPGRLISLSTKIISTVRSGIERG
jgi:hypothetical protein